MDAVIAIRWFNFPSHYYFTKGPRGNGPATDAQPVLQMPGPAAHSKKNQQGVRVMRMVPSQVRRGFWWEIILVGVLLFLLAGARSQRNRDVTAAGQGRAPPAVVSAFLPVAGR